MRLKRHYTTGDMAEKLNISKPFYCQIETGRRRLSYDMAIKIAAIFRAKPDKMFYEDHVEMINKSDGNLEDFFEDESDKKKGVKVGIISSLPKTTLPFD